MKQREREEVFRERVEYVLNRRLLCSFISKCKSTFQFLMWQKCATAYALHTETQTNHELGVVFQY